MTVDTLANEMATEFGEEYADADVATQFKRWVKEGYGTIMRDGRFPAANDDTTVTTSNGTREYALPATVAEVKVVARKGQASGGLGFTTVESLIRRGKDPEEAGTATEWYYSDYDESTNQIQLGLHPVPDAGDDGNDLLVFFLLRPKSLGDTDTIPLPDDFIDVVRLFVRKMVYQGDDNFQMAQNLKAEFNEQLQVLVARYVTPQRGESRIRAARRREVHQAPATQQS